MRGGLVAIVATATFLSTAGLASAATLNLTATQKDSIWQSLSSQPAQSAPAGFDAKVGEKVPQSLALHALPTNVTMQIPAAKEHQYVKLQNNEIVLVNPKDRQVDEVIMHQGTGSAK